MVCTMYLNSWQMITGGMETSFISGVLNGVFDIVWASVGVCAAYNIGWCFSAGHGTEASGLLMWCTIAGFKTKQQNDGTFHAIN